MFNGAQIHLMVNHIPVVGFLILTLCLLLTIFTHSGAIKRFILGLSVVIGLSALVPYWSGDSAEEVVEKFIKMDEQVVDRHEELAEISTVLSVITALFAACVLILERRYDWGIKLGYPLVFLIAVITTTFLGFTAHEGGLIHHPEINSAQQQKNYERLKSADSDD
ncbi:MAG: hypothetical protein KC505_07355 [Myxococcales bacterium]|nr:hypothetical protein [Myxococcales bacterium]USN50456.1 MAG: hypothetical protein H6731_09370 [Myxococcales bacterium]